MSEKINVSTLVKYLKNKLDSDNKLQGVLVSGEISNFHAHNSGHLYFSLKDNNAAISCVMFASKANTLKFVPKTGDKVIVNANTSIFEVSGQLQLYINSMKLDGIGDLYQQYEELKNKLEKQGYFDEDHKINIKTEYPNSVAVLVGDKSAAMSDINTQFNRRWPLTKVDYYPVLVQGNDAPKSIIKTLLEVDKKGYDAIILARGGGSFEDLFCFNDEELVKTIYNLKTFIVSGVGHEKDFTLTDFVSDLRAPTPTAAVELITPNIVDVIDELTKISELIKNKAINTLNTIKLRYDFYNTKLSNFSNIVNTLILKIDNSINSIQTKIKMIIDNNSLMIKNYEDILNKCSIESTLKRGYSIVYKDDMVINNSSKLKKKDKLNIKFYKGNKSVIVEE